MKISQKEWTTRYLSVNTCLPCFFSFCEDHWFIESRSSHSLMFFKIGVWKRITRRKTMKKKKKKSYDLRRRKAMIYKWFQGEYETCNFIIPLQLFSSTETATQVFSCEYCQIFKNSFFYKHLCLRFLLLNSCFSQIVSWHMI